MTTTASAPRSFSALASSQRRRRALVSLTPLIDVVFILLLFFMLASNFLDLHSIALDAPTGAAGKPAVEGALLVDVRLDGVRFAGRYIALDELTARVRRQMSSHPERRVLVRPAQGVSLQDTVRVLDALSGAGAAHISLMDAPGGAATR